MDHHDDDNRWDYDCPQFVDFTVPVPFNDGADQMFESTVIGEGPSTSTTQFLNHGGTEASPGAPGETSQDSHATAPEPAEDVKQLEKEEKQQPGGATEEPKKAKAPSNLVTSLESWRNPKKHGSSGPDESPNSKRPRKNSERSVGAGAGAAAHKAGPSVRMLTRSKSVRIPKSSSSSSLHTDRAAALAQTSGSRPNRSLTRTHSQGRSQSSSVDRGTEDGKLKGDGSATEKPARIPTLMKRLGGCEGLTSSSSSSKLKSSEELEMERIRQLKKELQHKRQMAKESYKKAILSKAVPVPVPVHAKVPTVPQEFQFQTDRRLNSQAENQVEEKGAGVDFVKSLRSRTVVSPGPSTSAPRKLTVPQPFHLTEKYSGKGSQTSAEAKFESVAEMVSAFHRKTPERFRARANNEDKGRDKVARSTSPGPRLTQPHTPNLTARNRHRPTHYLSHDQLETKEVEDMKQNQFKARPVNNKILATTVGVKKVASKAPTKVEEFALSLGVVHRKKEVEEESFEFHAQPLNRKIMEGTVGVKPAKPALPTIPQSPAFALKHRVRLPVELPEEKVDIGAPMRAKPVPHTGIPFQPKLPHQHTVPEPFCVDERSKVMLAQREEKIRQILEEERKAREFHAQPLPSHDPLLPEKNVKESTIPEPFQLETDQRGAFYVQEITHKVGGMQLTKEEEEQRKVAQFRAQPNRAIYQEPFIPARSNKALTEVSDFELNSDRRAVQREEFEMRKKEREAELDGNRRQREQRDKDEEDVAVAKLRAEMVHRPNPVRQYAPVLIKPSEKPLTDAESPQFSDRLRSKVRL